MKDATITDTPYFPAGVASGLKFLRPMRKLLDRLRPEAAHCNRELFFDHYISMLLYRSQLETADSIHGKQH
ncbi:MAG: hypothetical protein WCT04_14730, partial [Planctomycetota bacterium]